MQKNAFMAENEPINFEFRHMYLQLSADEEPVYEAYDRNISSFMAEVMDIEKFIKRNESTREVTNPIFFSRGTIPTPDGLLSNEIFGITQEERNGIYGYIDLQGTYLDPLCYKNWKSIDPTIKNIVHGIGKYSVDSSGKFVLDEENGSNGVDFLKKSFDKLKFKKNDSMKRNMCIDHILANKDKMFITKYPVIPAGYRDVNTGSKNIGVGEVNRLYAQLLTLARSPKEESYYGLSKSNAVAGRIQETILTLYDWFSGNNNSMIKDEGTGLSGKTGLIRRAGMTKTSDYCNRLVITPSDQRPETLSDMMVDLDHTALPLSAAMVDFYPYIIFILKRFFENEFSQYQKYPCIDSDGNVERVELKDPLIEFSDERINHEIKKFLHGHTNRFVPIEVPVTNEYLKNHKKKYMMFKGRDISDDELANLKDIKPDPIHIRPLTWTDVFYMAAVEATADKCILITRYPIDSKYNQFPTKIVVSSTLETESVYIGNTYYKFYPKITPEEINKDTSTKFVDTLIMSNLYLEAIKGDYDGDQTTAKGVYTVEANEELAKYMNSIANYIDLGCNLIRSPSKESIMAMYSMTILPPNTKITHPKFG